MKHASLGSVSSNTMRTEHLLEAFTAELEYHVQQNAKMWCSEDGRKQRDTFLALVNAAHEADPETEEADEILLELFDALEYFAPPNSYFGAHPNDGADYGFWPDE